MFKKMYLFSPKQTPSNAYIKHNTETVRIGMEDSFHMVPSTCPGGRL